MSLTMREPHASYAPPVLPMSASSKTGPACTCQQLKISGSTIVAGLVLALKSPSAYLLGKQYVCICWACRKMIHRASVSVQPARSRSQVIAAFRMHSLPVTGDSSRLPAAIPASRCCAGLPRCSCNTQIPTITLRGSNSHDQTAASPEMPEPQVWLLQPSGRPSGA